ncbi:hypothetical protein ABT324_20155 [Saccharopolyspora sp. NPDC000359]|uniref:hypothetical protein n=1 Tax=Saccharopolyspora sp. NPDC000359 TaxID=3154251 RepID=UPI0033284443
MPRRAHRFEPQCPWDPVSAVRADDGPAFDGTRKAIESGDWASRITGAVGAGLDALGTAILAAGVGWLMGTSVRSGALDALTGDGDQSKAHAETRKNVTAELGEINTEMTDLVNSDVADRTVVDLCCCGWQRGRA